MRPSLHEQIPDGAADNIRFIPGFIQRSNTLRTTDSTADAPFLLLLLIYVLYHDYTLMSSLERNPAQAVLNTVHPIFSDCG